MNARIRDLLMTLMVLLIPEFVLRRALPATRRLQHGKKWCVVIERSAFLIAALSSFSLLVVAARAAPPGGPLLAAALEGPMSDVEEIVFAVRAPGRDGHWYANFGYWASNEQQMMYGEDGGQLCALNLRTGAVRTILDDPRGGVRDPHVHYDGEKILFSYRRGESMYYHLYEINADGTGLRQLTDGPWDDLEPIYLPDGDILFCSSRCKRWVQCWHTHVAVRYRCDADGGDLHIVSSNVEQDNTPWMLPDGRVLYMRWEYVDRSRVRYHHLWTSNPDGTGEMVYFGNLHPGTVMLDAKPIPGTDNKVVAIFSPGHGRREHTGQVVIVDQKAGPDDRGHARNVSTSDVFRDPYPFSDNCLLVAAGDKDRGGTLMLMDGEGRTETIYTHDLDSRRFWVHEPRPLRRRKREPIVPERTDRSQATGRLVLADVNHSRRLDGVRRGEIKKLLVLETLPKPVNHSGTMEPISLDGTFTLERILGTVPVEADGSAYFEVPALRSVFFVALDEHDLSVKRMQSFVNVMPGETTACSGCHEQRTDAVRPIDVATLAAMRRRPHRIEPIPDVPDVFDFPRDIQPILDAHCVKCHGGQRLDGGVTLAGDRGPWYSLAYATLLSRPGLVSHGRDADGNHAARGIGSSASRLMQLIDGSHFEARLSPHEVTMIRLWIDTGAVYAGTYAALGTGMTAAGLPGDVFARRCAGCHPKQPPGQADLLYNLTHPEQSLVLRAPLAKQAGGLGICRTSLNKKDANPADVFTSDRDADYQRALAEITRAGQRLDQQKRFDMPGFRPSPHYVREMIRFGILPETFNAESDAVDVYQTDRRYWGSLWHTPGEL